MTVKPRKKK